MKGKKEKNKKEGRKRGRKKMKKIKRETWQAKEEKERLSRR